MSEAGGSSASSSSSDAESVVSSSSSTDPVSSRELNSSESVASGESGGGEGGDSGDVGDEEEAGGVENENGEGEGGSGSVDLARAESEIEEMKRRLAEMEEEDAKIAALQSQESAAQSISPAGSATAASGGAGGSSNAETRSSGGPGGGAAGAAGQFPASGPEVDSRSVYVGNVDYLSTPAELNSLFSACGPVNRVTILCDKFTGNPKGFAYIEFKDESSVQNALILNDTEFKGRQIKVTSKRTNVPAFQLSGRGRGGRGGFVPRGAPVAASGYYAAPRGRGGYRGGYAPGGYAPAPRGRFVNRRGVYAPPY